MSVIKLKALRWEFILDYLSVPSIITRVLTSGRQEGWSQRRRSHNGSRGQWDVGANQEMQVAFRSQTRQGMDSPLAPPKDHSS